MTLFRPALLALVCALGLCCWSSSAATLITDDEAQRPIDPHIDQPRGISRGPTASLDDSNVTVTAHTPFEFKVKLQAHGGAQIDPNKVRVTYLKLPHVDLTDRLRAFVSASGIDMPDAVVPAGDHPIRVTAEDSDGRTSGTLFSLRALP